MKLNAEIDSKTYQIDTAHPLDISIPLNFNGDQPSHFGAPPATSTTVESGDFIGDTNRGGGCNVEAYQLVPHCNGTHTESAGHILNTPVSIQQIFKDPFFPCTVISVQPENAFDSSDNYLPPKERNDKMITAALLQDALKNVPLSFLKGLVIRTRPNSEAKKSRNYLDHSPPFFSMDAMTAICDLGVQHLLVDMPSVDRMFDEGKLTAHHIFWNVNPGDHRANPDTRLENTITEMIYAPDHIADGSYICSIQIPNFVADAAPSRVFLYQLHDVKG